VGGAGATKDQLEEIVADESLGLIDHYRIVRCGLYKGFTAAAELGDSNSLALLSGRLHENFRDCGRLTGELQRGPLQGEGDGMPGHAERSSKLKAQVNIGTSRVWIVTPQRASSRLPI
jgi:hypothetical protein